MKLTACTNIQQLTWVVGYNRVRLTVMVADYYYDSGISLKSWVRWWFQTISCNFPSLKQHPVLNIYIAPSSKSAITDIDQIDREISCFTCNPIVYRTNDRSSMPVTRLDRGRNPFLTIFTAACKWDRSGSCTCQESGSNLQLCCPSIRYMCFFGTRALCLRYVVPWKDDTNLWNVT